MALNPLDALKSFGKMLYPMAEPLLNEEIDSAAASIGGIIVDEVKDTATKWDDEGAEKLARLLEGVAATIKGGLAAPAPTE